MSLKTFIKKKIKKLIIKKVKTPFVKNINLDLTKIQKRVLISYIDHFSTADLNLKISHTSLLESIQIINIFKEFDYIIDVVHCNSEESLEFLKRERYDIIFGFGEVFRKISKLNPLAKKIIYVTENHPKLSLRKELERNKYFYDRTRKKIPLRRSGVYYKEEDFEDIDYAVILGEKVPFEKYSFKKYNIFPTGFLNKNYIFKIRDMSNSQKNFLWLGSNGAVHKGLDLLIEVFEKHPELNLHICGFNPEEKYLKIPKLKNIINYGRIDIQGNEFLELAEKCSYIILPSCSEGFSTSIATGMLHSIIPVVCKDTGFNRLHDKAIFLEDYKVKYLEDKIKELSLKDINEIQNLQNQIYTYSNDNFTIHQFTINFRNIVEEILQDID